MLDRRRRQWSNIEPTLVQRRLDSAESGVASLLHIYHSFEADIVDAIASFRRWKIPVCLQNIFHIFGAGNRMIDLSPYLDIAYWLCLPLCTQTWGHVGSLMFAQCVCRVLSCPSVKRSRRSNTRHWLNAGLMLPHPLRRWPNIIPVLSYRVVFGVTLNVGQRHRIRANINPALVQSIVPVPSAWITLLGLYGYWPALA